MKAKNLIFKRRISLLGVVLFIMVSSFTLSLKTVKWGFKSLYRFSKWIRNYARLSKSGYSYNDLYDLIQTMSGIEFEKFCYILFKELGYNVKQTQQTNDGGKDLILFNEEEGYTYVECKRWNDSVKVGRPELQKLVGSATGDGVGNMLFITTGKYNSNAREYAKKIDNLELWEMEDLMRYIFKIDVKRIPYILMKTFNNSSTRIIRFKPFKG